MNTPILSALAVLIALHAAHALANERDKKPDEPTRDVCMNLYCTYFADRDKDDSPKCFAAATFTKLVTHEGGEARDGAQGLNVSRFEVECDQRRVYTGGGTRFTDFAGTRLQAATGPYPALLLPRRALKEGHRYVPSALELTGGEGYSGYCFVYTGPQ